MFITQNDSIHYPLRVVQIWQIISIKVEYHANENPLTNSEKRAYVGQRLMYPIKKPNLTTLDFFKCH